MAKKPPGPNRPVNGDVSVDLRSFLEKLSRVLEWDGDQEQLGLPGSYEPKGGSDTPDRFAVNYLFREIMSKFDDRRKDTDALKTAEALAKFREAEELCSISNEWFSRRHLEGDFLRDCDPDVGQALVLAREKLRTWLGPFSWDEAAEGFRFTSGASFGMPCTRSTPVHKYSAAVEVTIGAAPLIEAALRWNPAWGASFGGKTPLNVVEGNRVLCVPKNYKVHRTIAAEPSGNMFLQKGIGYALRRRLQAVGVYLQSQQMNQDFAYMGSLTGLVATVDLSMASDTVSKGIVEWAMPPDWVSAMSLCRSPFGVLPSGKVLYRKWSSMGNAYTFELESILFLALVRACCDLSGCDQRFSTVYGDDIVCPVGACELLYRVLARCGFKVNGKKSFVSGPFRESCGKHYFLGKDVSPFYIRSQPSKLTDLFLLVNNLQRWVWRTDGLFSEEVTQKLQNLCSSMRSFAPSPWRKPRIPDGVGNGAFIGTFDVCRPSRPRGKWLHFEGWQVEVLTECTKRITVYEGELINVTAVKQYLLGEMRGREPPIMFNTEGYRVSEKFVENSLKDSEMFDSLRSAPSEVIPNRDRRWRITTMIVTQF